VLVPVLVLVRSAHHALFYFYIDKQQAVANWCHTPHSTQWCPVPSAASDGARASR
jgi:hypothetical protein